jgi:IS605 OrfB family transposase
MQKRVQLTVVGKVFKPNAHKLRLLNRCQDKYYKLVRWYLRFNTTSKNALHRHYAEAKAFGLNTALVQTARDEAVETLKSFRENRAEDSILALKKVSIRFDRRCYRFSKTANKMTPYWLTLSLGEERVVLPVVFGEREKLIEEALEDKWKFATVEMTKDEEWYAHFTLGKIVEIEDELETIVAIDRGERNLAVAAAIAKENPEKPMNGKFWKGADIKRTRGLYGHVRRSLQRKGRAGKVKAIGQRENRIVDQMLHRTANEIVQYALRFEKPVIAMEDLTGIRGRFKGGRRLNRRFHALPFRKLQELVEYKALLRGIEVRYVSARNTTRTCHRCGHVAPVMGRTIRCGECGLEYDRDLNAAVNIARRLTRSAGWGSRDAPEPAGVAEGEKPRPNAGSPCL